MNLNLRIPSAREGSWPPQVDGTRSAFIPSGARLSVVPHTGLPVVPHASTQVTSPVPGLHDLWASGQFMARRPGSHYPFQRDWNWVAREGALSTQLVAPAQPTFFSSGVRDIDLLIAGAYVSPSAVLALAESNISVGNKKAIAWAFSEGHIHTEITLSPLLSVLIRRFDLLSYCLDGLIKYPPNWRYADVILGPLRRWYRRQGGAPFGLTDVLNRFIDQALKIRASIHHDSRNLDPVWLIHRHLSRLPEMSKFHFWMGIIEQLPVTYRAISRLDCATRVIAYLHGFRNANSINPTDVERVLASMYNGMWGNSKKTKEALIPIVKFVNSENEREIFSELVRNDYWERPELVLPLTLAAVQSDNAVVRSDITQLLDRMKKSRTQWIRMIVDDVPGVDGGRFESTLAKSFQLDIWPHQNKILRSVAVGSTHFPVVNYLVRADFFAYQLSSRVTAALLPIVVVAGTDQLVPWDAMVTYIQSDLPIFSDVIGGLCGWSEPTVQDQLIASFSNWRWGKNPEILAYLALGIGPNWKLDPLLALAIRESITAGHWDSCQLACFQLDYNGL